MAHRLAVTFCFVAWGVAVGARAQGPLRTAGPPSQWESCEELHDTYLKRFEATDGMGLSRMYRPPMRDLSGVLDLGRARFSLTRLELIGLLQGPTPVVYTPFSHTSRPDPAADSRALTAFEARALADFRKWRDMATDEDRNGLTACAGAIRAAPACLKCHDNAKDGDLLGAFSYGFVRERAN